MTALTQLTELHGEVISVFCVNLCVHKTEDEKFTVKKITDFRFRDVNMPVRPLWVVGGFTELWVVLPISSCISLSIRWREEPAGLQPQRRRVNGWNVNAG